MPDMAEYRLNDTSVLLFSAVISLGGIIVSIISAVFIAGTRWGNVNARLTNLETHSASKEDLQGVKESLAEIKGMFHLTLKDGKV